MMFIKEIITLSVMLIDCNPNINKLRDCSFEKQESIPVGCVLFACQQSLGGSVLGGFCP